MTEEKIAKVNILDIHGVLEDSVDGGIDAERFEYNLHEDQAVAELEQLEAAIRATGVQV